jgi:hypothetical protein
MPQLGHFKAKALISNDAIVTILPLIANHKLLNTADKSNKAHPLAIITIEARASILDIFFISFLLNQTIFHASISNRNYPLPVYANE